MAQRHWLDPLARQVLRAAGQIPAPRRQPDPSVSGDAPPDQSRQEEVERDLLALKLQQNPALRLEDAAAVERAAALGWRLDVNRATAADWLRLPGLGPAQVDLLLRLQAGGVQLSGSEDLQRVLELSEAMVQTWLPLLEFRWYGEPAMPAGPPSRIDLNRASPRELEPLGLGPDRLSRLLRERSRSPFLDLADLQQRLQLPASLVESWIGRVQFRPGPAGPVLPPASKGPSVKGR
jgi:DNA uptake protein ComE-like DNA-binding protein